MASSTRPQATIAGLEAAIARAPQLLDGAVLRRLALWAQDPDARPRIEALIAGEDWDEIRDAFGGELTFGTAGLRGRMGIGPNRMNAQMVGIATRALAAYLLELHAAHRGVVVSWDTRRESAAFAARVRDLLSAQGVRVFCFDADRPAPELSFAVRETGAIAGVMITASHNPKDDNGYKISWEHGGQIGPEIADAIFSRMTELLPETGVFAAPTAAPPARRAEVVTLGHEVDEAYLKQLTAHVLDHAALADLRVVYDPLYGCGRRLLPEALLRAGLRAENLTMVEAHARPPAHGELGDFVGLTSLNPADRGVLDEAFALARAWGADLVLATDPDADRLVAGIEVDGAWTRLAANQTWPMVLEDRLTALAARGELTPDMVVVRSWVTTSLLDAIARAHGIRAVEVPTGFKWIAEEMTRRNVVGGFEESDGMSVGTHTREKDALLAALLVAEMAARAKARGETLAERLDGLARRFGRHENLARHLSFAGLEGRRALDRVRAVLCADPSAPFPADEVAEVTARHDGVEARLRAGTRVIIRPSGTEAKLKVYVEQVGAPAAGRPVEGGGRAEAERALEETCARLAQFARGDAAIRDPAARAAVRDPVASAAPGRPRD